MATACGILNSRPPWHGTSIYDEHELEKIGRRGFREKASEEQRYEYLYPPLVSGERATAPGAAYETYRHVRQDFAEAQDQLEGGSAFFIDCKAANG